MKVILYKSVRARIDGPLSIVDSGRPVHVLVCLPFGTSLHAASFQIVAICVLTDEEGPGQFCAFSVVLGFFCL